MVIFDKDYVEDNKKIQLMTFNFLLGNPGEKYLKQAENKQIHFNRLLHKCHTENKKIIMILDEVHDAIYNFKEEYVFNLFRLRNYVQKIFVSSATFNEASKVVIKYLAELTDKKIKIYESPRIQIEETLSELNVVVNNNNYYKADDDFLNEIFDLEIGKATRINVLSFTKSFAKDLTDSKIGKRLSKVYGGINLCTAETDNIFDESKCNVGTNFKTGISINQENSAFFIFLPYKSVYSNSQRDQGIFEDGINSLIQALARPRRKSRIYVVTPSVTVNFIKADTPFPEQYHIIDINYQDTLLRYHYDTIKYKVAG